MKKKKKDPVVSPDQIQTMKMLHIYASYFYSSWFISYKTTKKKRRFFLEKPPKISTRI